MFKNHSKKPLVTAITAVITTSVLLACTPSQQEQSKIESMPLPVDKIAVVEEDRELKTTIGKLPQSVVQERLRKQKTRMQQ